MSQHIPDRMYIRAVFQQVRREGVTKSAVLQILSLLLNMLANYLV